MREALHSILQDEGFKIPTELARRAHDNAEKLLHWVDNETNATLTMAFASKLIDTLEGCFRQTGSVHVRRERLCEGYFKARSSDHYRAMWMQFISTSIHAGACPVLYQAVTDRIMEQLIKVHFPLQTANSSQLVPSLDHIEKNVVRYMAGYVIHALMKKTSRTSHPMKEELMLCLTELDDEEGQ